jgi:two-component system response regulator AlgR
MKVMVVDDERPARERLRDLLSTLPAYQCCGEAGNGIDALQLVQSQQPDIVLMDIRMPGMDGLETARHLASLDKPPAVIFTTAYGDYALEAFDAQAAGYLLKPVDKRRLEEALVKARIPNRAQLTELAVVSVSGTRTHICARLGGRLELVPLGDIVYFRADQKYVTVRHRQGEVLIEDALKSLEREFSSLCLRVHRNALVMAAQLVGLEKTRQGHVQVLLNGVSDRLEVSRRHVTAIRRFLRSR